VIGASVIGASAIIATGCVGGAETISGPSLYTPRGAFGGGSSGATTGGVVDPALVGRWSRTIEYNNNQGEFHTSQLIFEFQGDGGGRRITITANQVQGLVSTEIVPFTWRATSGNVRMTLLSPGGVILSYNYSAGTARLSLGPFVLDRLV
jgi:hypothetical protein